MQPLQKPLLLAWYDININQNQEYLLELVSWIPRSHNGLQNLMQNVDLKTKRKHIWNLKYHINIYTVVVVPRLRLTYLKINNLLCYWSTKIGWQCDDKVPHPLPFSLLKGVFVSTVWTQITYLFYILSCQCIVYPFNTENLTKPTTYIFKPHPESDTWVFGGNFIPLLFREKK